MGKMFLTILAAIVLAGFTAAAKDERFAADGKPLYVIAKPVNAKPTEARAASELAAYLKRITDVEYQIVEENAVAEGQKTVYTGQSAYAAKAGIDFSKLAPEEWIIQMQPDGNLILTGGTLVGIIYSVYDYLERCGVRWYDEQAEVVPKDKNLLVERLFNHWYHFDGKKPLPIKSLEADAKNLIGPNGRMYIRRKFIIILRVKPVSDSQNEHERHRQSESDSKPHNINGRPAE